MTANNQSELLQIAGLNPAFFRVKSVQHFTDGKPAAPPAEKPQLGYTPQSAKERTTRIIDEVLDAAEWSDMLAFDDAGVNFNTARQELARRIEASTVRMRTVGKRNKKEYGWVPGKEQKCRQ